MTLFARQDDHNPQNIMVSCTYGPTEFHVTEDAASLRHFHGQLGDVLDKAEAAPQLHPELHEQGKD